MALVLVTRATQLYDGLTPTVYANTVSLGSGSGASEANATTLTGALASATAGDIIGVLPGVYSGTPSGDAWTPLFKTTNSGTSGSPIIIVGKYDHLYYYGNAALRCEIRSTAPVTPVDSTNRPGFGLAPTQSYIQWRNFFLDGTYVPPNPSHGMSVFGYQTTGGRFRKCVFRMLVQNNGTDNRNAIFMEGCGTAQVDYCYFYDGSTTGAGRHVNNNGITIYPAANPSYYPTVTLEHNTFRDCNAGIFVKGRSGTDNIQGSYGTIRYNAFYDLSHVGISHQGEDPTAGMDFYQNLLVRCAFGGFAKENGLENLVPELYERARIYNNTMVDCGTQNAARAAVYLRNYPAAGVNYYEYYNNIVTYSAATSFAFDTSDPNYSSTNQLDADEVYSTLNYNWYYYSGGSVQFRERSGTATGIAAWRTATGMEANSTEASVPFLNASADDYRLSSTDTGSSTGGARGCYITGNETIGNGVN